jgi:hypothetical protein
MLEYSIPLGLPISRKSSGGSLKGRLYDVENKIGMGNVILRLNNSEAVTDRNGNFVFPYLEPGKYFLQVDRAGIGMDRVPTQKTPIEVIITGGKEMRIDVGVIRSANLNGQVMVYEPLNNNHNGFLNGNPKENSPFIIGNGNNHDGHLNNSNSNHNGKTELVESYGLANVIVELTNSSEIQRRVTDPKGRFSFEDLRPGEWTLKVYDYNLPEYHYLEKDSIEIELEPGEREDITIKVLPKKRPVQIIKTGEVISEERITLKKVEQAKTYEEQYNEALNLYLSYQYEKALAIFQFLLSSDISHSLADNCQYWIGECYFGMKSYKKALESFQKVLSFPQSNKNEDALFMMARCYLNLGKKEEASRTLQRFIDEYPKSRHIESALNIFLKLLEKR